MIQILHHCTIELFLTVVFGTTLTIVITALTFDSL
jgi:hypothetical protein